MCKRQIAEFYSSGRNVYWRGRRHFELCEFFSRIPRYLETEVSILLSKIGLLTFFWASPFDTEACVIRFSDFIVNEVDLAGNVTHLTNLEAPSQVIENGTPWDVFVSRWSLSGEQMWLGLPMNKYVSRLHICIYNPWRKRVVSFRFWWTCTSSLVDMKHENWKPTLSKIVRVIVSIWTFSWPLARKCAIWHDGMNNFCYKSKAGLQALSLKS